MKTAYKNIGLLALVIASGVISSVAYATEEAPGKDVKKTEEVGNVTALKKRAETLWSSTIEKCKGAVTHVKTQTKGVRDFVMTDKVGNNMSWARYAMILRNVGGMAFSVLATYVVFKKLLSVLESCMYDISEEDMQKALKRRENNKRPTVIACA